MKVTNSYCDNCKEKTRHETNINHILHLLLSIFTGGLWILVWLSLGLDTKSHCAICGTTSKANSSKVRYSSNKRTDAVGAGETSQGDQIDIDKIIVISCCVLLGVLAMGWWIYDWFIL